jgi:hypothetical protein
MGVIHFTCDKKLRMQSAKMIMTIPEKREDIANKCVVVVTVRIVRKTENLL